MLDLQKPWKNFEFVAFDTETSGAYPVGFEIVEFGAVKWREGRIVETYQTLLKPSRPMSPFVISIHGITNEMVQDAPLMREKIAEIRRFLGDAIPMAHHAPFDMGFVALDFEKNGISFPQNPVLCTSLLARKTITESPNHKLQTLIGILGLEKGAAHRAQDDAAACLQVGLESMRRLGEVSLGRVFETQEKRLTWDQYSLLRSGDDLVSKVVECIENGLCLDIVYQGGSNAGENRRITPIGIVRNPDGDFVMAKCHRNADNRRFYLSKIKDAAVAY